MRLPHRPALAVIGVLLLVLAGSFAWGQRLSSDAALERAVATRATQVEACERGNLVRTEINLRGDILVEFLETAAAARQASGEAAGPLEGAADLATAARYRELANQVVAVEVPDCEQVIDPVPG